MSAAVLEDLDWHADCMNMIAAFAKSGLRFSADDIRKSMRPAPKPNDVGAAFRAACTLGLITTVGFQESTTPSRKSGVIRVWQKASES